MADNKKYYYLKLKENFFDSDAMIMLESMEDGYLYSNILLKLYLRSLKGNGKLMFNDKIPYNSVMLAKITRHAVGVVEKAIRIFKDLELIDIFDNGSIYMMDIQNFVGESSTEADRIRAYRKKISEEKQALSEGCTNVQELPYKSTPEIEIEIEKEIELEIELEQEQEPTRTSALDDGFESFWDVYPRKVGKGKAKERWKKLKPSKALQDKMIAAVTEQKESVQWQKDNGQYIPNPDTWINQERWNDQLVKARTNDTYDHDDFFKAAMRRK